MNRGIPGMIVPTRHESIRNVMDGPQRLERLVARSPLLSAVVAGWNGIALPDCYLVAGAVAQSAWNDAFGFDMAHGITDIDLIYYDPADLSAEAEAAHASRMRALFARLPVWIDVKNEARVHLWYEAKFGYPIKPYASSADAITTFPTTAGSVGLRPGPDGLIIEAPYGLSDLFGLIVRPNRKQITRAIYEAKVARWSALWPGLTVMPWDET